MFVERDINNKIIAQYNCDQYDENGDLKKLEYIDTNNSDYLILQQIASKVSQIKEKFAQSVLEDCNINNYMAEVQAALTTTLSAAEFKTKVQNKQTLLSEISTLKSEISTLQDSIGQT